MKKNNSISIPCFLLMVLLLMFANSCKKDVIVKKDPIITWANPADISIGTLLSATQLNATADVPGTFVYNPTIGTKLGEAANQDLKVDFTPNGVDSYNSTSKTVKINVVPKKVPVIIWKNPVDINFGTLLSVIQLNATADIPGIFVYTPAIGTILNEGANQDLKVDFTPNDILNYNSASKTVQINVLPKRRAPVVTWKKPATIVFGTLLSDTQLNATADVPGTFVYTPAIGTKLGEGNFQVLKVVFTPTDTILYYTAKKTISINVLPEGSVLVYDTDGNLYTTVQIGTQLWIVQNLKTTKYNDGTPIPLVNRNEATAWTKLTTPGCTWYEYYDPQKEEYGALYNWYAVNTNKLAPVGWHIPTDKEWQTLVDFLGGDAIAGGKLKETSFAHWEADNIEASNSSGFTGRGAGCRHFSSGDYLYIKRNAYWWTSTPDGPARAWGWGISYGDDTADRVSYKNQFGFSVRCIKD